MTDAANRPLHVLIYAPIGRDGELTATLLTRAGIASHIRQSMEEVCDGVHDGAGAVLLTEEALHARNVDLLSATLEAQPAWSDISVLLFAGSSDCSETSMLTLRKLEVLRNVTLLDRPIRVFAVVSMVQAALRGRRRQYELRDVLVELHAARGIAEQASRLKDEFLATLSHELRTPLNAILGWVSMLRDERIEAARIPGVLEVIERNAKAQNQLIADVLDVSRMITGRVTLDLSPVDVVAVLRDGLNTVRPAADAKGLRLELHPSLPPVPPINGDSARLQQVFWNLLSNAVKFTPPGGRIDVHVTYDAEALDVAISDTGVGLTPEFVPHAFERFRQADQSFTRAYGGLGLGLAIVKNLVEMHGGQVTVKSEQNRGATFRVRLPLAGMAAAAARDHEQPLVVRERVRCDFRGQSILVVDDDPTTRDLLTAVLSDCNARVTAVESATAAIRELDVTMPALLLADIGMPDEDGLSLMRRVRGRSEEKSGRVPSIALSAYARREDREAALAAGFDDFLTKPAQPMEIIAAIEKWLRPLPSPDKMTRT